MIDTRSRVGWRGWAALLLVAAGCGTVGPGGDGGGALDGSGLDAPPGDGARGDGPLRDGPVDGAARTDGVPGDGARSDWPRRDGAGDMAARFDGARDGVAPVDLPPLTDGPGRDGPLGDSARRDAGGLADAAPGDGPAAASCKAHCDCVQGQFCYYGTCLFDPKLPVYCCGKPGCPPGRRCIEANGTKGVCAESTTHACKDACDCGPAHCCLGGRCVKDQADPWSPGPGVGNSPPGTCKQGTDATYCCTDALCHSGRQAYGSAGSLFKCFDRTRSALGSVEGACGGKSCFGTACNCGAGESCVDTAATSPTAGKGCLLFSGGSCISNAVAEAVYGFSSSELLPCCSKGCLKGQACDLGWRSGGTSTYERVQATCGSCGNGTCEAGEYPSNCPADCKLACGDGRCDPGESCPADCGCTVDGVCQPWEGAGCADCAGKWSCADSQLFAASHQVCGDGICTVQTCSTKPESCRTCPQDCGACEWQVVHSAGWAGAGASLEGVWGSSGSDVFAVGGGGTILHSSGTGWSLMISGTTQYLTGVWGSSGSDVFAVGAGGTILHYSGTSWAPMISGTTQYLIGVWGSSGSDVFAVGAGGTILHYNGTSWTPMTSGTSQYLWAVWGRSGTDVFAVGSGGMVLHYDGMGWSPMTSGITATLYDVRGSSGSDVFAVGARGTILRYNGASWATMTSGTSQQLNGVWGSSGSDVFAVGAGATILHFDGRSWSSRASGAGTSLNGVWGSTAGDVFAAGSGGTILHFDGTVWTAAAIGGSSSRLYSAWGSSASDVIAVGASGTVLRYDGSVWNGTRVGPSVLPPVTYFVGSAHYTSLGVWGSSASDVFVVGIYDPMILKSGPDPGGGPLFEPPYPKVFHNDGARWSEMILDASWRRGLNAVWGSSGGDVFAVGGGGTVLHYGGTVWSAMASGTTQQLSGVWGSSGSDLFAVGHGGTILHYDGTSWTPMTSGTTEELRGVIGRSGSEVFAVGLSGALLRYNGVTWRSVRADLRDLSGVYVCLNLHGTAQPPAGEVLAVGDREVVFGSCAGGVCPPPATPPSSGPPLPVCPNGKCEAGESCDGRNGTKFCADCPGKTSGPPKDQYCCVAGGCVGQGCVNVRCP